MEGELIKPEDAAKMIHQFDVAAIRAEMERHLGIPKCGTFVTQLLALVSRKASPGNTPVEGGNVLKVFDKVQSQEGLVRAGDTANGARGGASFRCARRARRSCGAWASRAAATTS